MEIPLDADNPTALPAGWARPPLSSFFHWFDAAESISGDLSLRRSLCGLARYSGATVPEIRRWESDPAICELCRDIRRARARGGPLPGQSMRTVALVPVGLPERIRTVFQEASARGADGPPFHQTLAHFRAEGVTRAFLAAFLRRDVAREGRRPLGAKPLLFGHELTLDAVRETAGATRVHVVREPIADAEPKPANASQT